MLIRIHKIVIRAVIQEQEPESHGEAPHRGTPVAELGVRCPGEDKQADGDEPATAHHRHKADFCRGRAAVTRAEREVVFVHQRCAGGGAEDADRDGDEHEAGGGGGVVFPALVDDGVGDEEYVEEAVEDGHVEAEEEDDEFAEEELEGADEEDAEAFGEGPEVEVLFGDEVYVLFA